MKFIILQQWIKNIQWLIDYYSKFLINNNFKIKKYKIKNYYL